MILTDNKYKSQNVKFLFIKKNFKIECHDLQNNEYKILV